MNTRIAMRRVGKDIANMGAIPQGNQNAPKVQATANDQVPVNPPVMTDAEVRAALFLIAQAINTQVQALTAQANMEVSPQEDQHVSTVASRLRDSTRMDPPKYFGLKVDEDPQDFLDEVYKIFLLWG